MNNPIAIANYFVSKSINDGCELTPMKLVKLTYMSHGWHLGLSDGKPLLSEAVEAWKFGPVVPSVYRSFKKYGNSQITSLEFDTNSFSNEPSIVSEPELTKFLDKIWDVYCGYSGLQLSTLTHQKDTPWDLVWNSGNGKDSRSVPIPNNIITDYYKKKIAGEVQFA